MVRYSWRQESHTVSELQGRNNRLDSIDKKFERVADALLQLATIEERTSTHNSALERIWKKIANMEARVIAMELTGAVYTTKLGISERVFWILFTAGVALAGKMLW